MINIKKKKPRVDNDIVIANVEAEARRDSKGRLYNAIYDNSQWGAIKELRNEYDATTKGWSKSRTRRHIASIPYELYF